MRRRWWAWVLAVLAGVLLIAVLGFVVWAETPMGPMPEAVAALESGSDVTVDRDGPIVFRPTGGSPSTGLVFYPGARVDPESYAPALRALAEQGYLTVVVPMPLNLAVLGSGRAADVMADFPDIERWAVGGHSLGGAMAAAFAVDHPDTVDGLALWAAYPAAGDDLSAGGVTVASISATNDGLTTADDIARTRLLLPSDTEFVVIDGGNHAQFGWYGEQGGDGVATIDRPEQQSQVVAATLRLLERLEAPR